MIEKNKQKWKMRFPSSAVTVIGQLSWGAGRFCRWTLIRCFQVRDTGGDSGAQR